MASPLAEQVTADNALSLLAGSVCTHCGEIGQFETFREPNNNAIGLRCRGCGKTHPIAGIMWLRQGAPRRSNDIQATMRERGAYCWMCGATYATLRERKMGMHVHHTRPFAVFGEQVEKIPLCARCHEVATAMQRYSQA